MEETNILIVEDEDLVSDDIFEALEHYGYTVVGRAATGEDAIALAKDELPDLVLMDIRLEGNMDGIHAARIIRESLNIPVIFLTAYADDTTLERAMVTEPYGYVLKPFKELELRTAIEMALHKHATQGEPSPGRLAAVSQPNEQQGEKKEELDESEVEILRLLHTIPPFSLLDRHSLQDIARRSNLQKVAANEPLAFEGEVKDRGFVVIEGRVALTKSSANGKDLIVELLPPGDPFPLFAVVDGKQYSTTVKAQIASTVLWVSRADVMSAVDRCPEVGSSLIEVVFQRLRKAHDLSRALAHDLVEVRVASALHALIPSLCLTEDLASGPAYVIHMTRQELAEMIGSTSETVIRATKAMEREGLLDLSSSGTIRILKKEELARMSATAAG